MEEASVGDRVLHYANSNIRAVGTVTAEAVDAERPTGSDDDWQRDGRLVQVDYAELSQPINLGDIPHEWRTDEGGPFNKDGRMQQGYSFAVQHVCCADGPEISATWTRGDTRYGPRWSAYYGI